MCLEAASTDRKVTLVHKEIEDQQSAHERFPAPAPVHVAQVSADLLTINSRRYSLVLNYKDGLRKDALADRYEQILDKFDYVVGDWGFEKLRLKGFYKDDRKQAAPDQKIGHLEDYLYEYCNFGCAYFVLERIDAPTETETTPKPHRGGRNRNRRGGRNTAPRRSEGGRSDSEAKQSSHNRGGSNHRGNRSQSGRSEQQKAGYSERRVRDRKPERGQHERASTSTKRGGRHFSIRTLDEK